MPVMPRAAARSSVRRYASGETSGSTTSVDAGVGVVPLVLGDHPVAQGEAEPLQRPGVEPGVVSVAGDQHDRYVGRDRVQCGDGGLGLPHAEPVSGADQRSGVLREVVDSPGRPRARATPSRRGRAAGRARSTGRGGRGGPRARGSASGRPRRTPRSRAACPARARCSGRRPRSTTTSTGPAHPGPRPNSTIRTLRRTKSATRTP